MSSLSRAGAAFAVSVFLVNGLTAAEVGAAGETCFGRAASIVGTPGADILVGTSGRDVIVGAAGDDQITGDRGDDLICGGPGADVLDAGPGTDRAFGGSGGDAITDASPFVVDGEQLSGGSGADVIRSESAQGQFGNSTSRLLQGGRGSDRLFSSAIDDMLTGGPGSDTLLLRFGGALTGGEGTDVLRGAPDGITDFFLTGDGDEVHVRTQRGRVTGTGLRYGKAPGPVVIDPLAGFGRVRGSLTHDTVAGLDDPTEQWLLILGTGGDDILRGTNVARTTNVLFGMGGNDQLRGFDGPDFVWGRTGDDLLAGGRGNDTGGGGDGNDTCVSVENLENC